MVKAMVGGCCVCSDERGWDENPLVYCDGHGCDVAVHQACYGIVQVPKGPWFCRKCESQERIARVKCELCPSKSGALKRTDTGGWAHVVCALYIPEVRFGNVTTMEPIILASVPHERYLKMCYICEERGKESKTAHGGCMNCNKQGCRQTFHVTCAQSCGFLCEENDGQSGPTVKYVGYCQFHWTRRNKGLLNNKTPEKEKPKLKLDKDKEKEKKPKSRTSSESTSSPSASQPTKTDNSPKPPSSTSSSPSVTAVSLPSTPPTTVLTPGMPKQRGRKPSTVKTLPPANNNTANDASTKTQPVVTTKESTSAPAKVVTSPSVSVMATTVSTPLNTSAVTTLSSESIVTPIQNSKNILSSSQSVAKVTPSPTPVSVPMPKTTPQVKPAAKATLVSKKPANQVKQPPKKRPSSKSDDEPKRKVGRPPLKSKTPDSKPRPRPPSASRPAKPKTQNKNKDESSPMMVTSSPTTSLPGFSGYSVNSVTTSSPLPIHHSLPPRSVHNVSPYVIPQPRLAGQLDSGHRVPEQPSQQTNGPLQLPSSLEQLLEYQWEQGAQFLMQQASQYDVASLMSSLHQLKADNSRLESRLDSLLARRSQLLQVSSRLSASMSCTPTNTSSTTTDVSNKEPARTKVTPSSAQPVTTLSANIQTSRQVTGVATKTTSSVANVETVGSLNTLPKVSATLSFPASSAPLENKSMAGKGKVDKGKSPPMKLPISSPTAVASLSATQNATVPKMVTPKTVGLQPNQIKITMLQPHTSQTASEKDKTKTTATAAPIAILPTALQNSMSHLLHNQQLQVLQAQAKQAQGKNKQPLILPHQAVTSQAFTTQQFPQQQQQFVLLMQQQQQLQQLQRQGQSALFRTEQPAQNQLASTQSKSTSSAHTQKFVPSAMPLGYPSGFVTFSDGLGIPAGQHIDVSKPTAFATLPLVQLDKSKGVDHTDKNGTALPSDKALKKS